MASAAPATTSTNPAPETVKRLKARAEKAWQKRANFEPLMRDVYDYVMPYRDTTGLTTSSATKPEGAKRTDKVFDSTAVMAAFRFPGRMQRELTPLFNDFFSIEPGPVLPEEQEREKMRERMQRVGATVHAVLMSSEWASATHEFYTDLYAGTGHMNIEPGPEQGTIRVRCVPFCEVAIEEGPWGNVERWYWKRSYLLEDLARLWPKAELSERMKLDIVDKPETPVSVCQYTYWDEAARKFVLLVWCDRQDDADKPFWRAEFRTSPWITARFWKLPGEAYGRGPAMLAMPSVKTLNMARELALKAAAIALMGIWIYRNDRIFNPDTVRFEPRAMWAVSSTGGPLGKTIERLPVPTDFDVSTIVVSEERDQAKKVLLDEQLPPMADAVRSPTEIVQRITQRNEDMGGILGRATFEIILPVVRRVIDVLEAQGVLQGVITIDQVITMLRVIAPIAAAQQADKVKGVVDWLQILSMLGGTQLTALSAKIEELAPQIGRWLGVEEQWIRSAEGRKQLMELVAQLVAAQQQTEMANAAPKPTSAETAQQIVNGGPA